MSLEDVRRSTTSLVAESCNSDHCNGHSAVQDEDQELERQKQGQDGIVLERIASLSLDMFEPSDFTGRFTKIQQRSRKRTRIIRGGYQRVHFLVPWQFRFLNSYFGWLVIIV